MCWQKMQMKNFYKELRAMQKKYPMCYIEAWTPEDYDSVDANYDEDDPDPESNTDWNLDEHHDTASKLYKYFDANYGTNWERIRECK